MGKGHASRKSHHLMEEAEELAKTVKHQAENTLDAAGHGASKAAAKALGQLETWAGSAKNKMKDR